jgi:hypothetical protein
LGIAAARSYAAAIVAVRRERRSVEREPELPRPVCRLVDPPRAVAAEVAYLPVNPAGGSAMIVALWESNEALDASASRAAICLREEASATAGATIGSVDSDEVAFEVVGGEGA